MPLKSTMKMCLVSKSGSYCHFSRRLTLSQPLSAKLNAAID
jgi:hypothetical protein